MRKIKRILSFQVLKRKLGHQILFSERGVQRYLCYIGVGALPGWTGILHIHYIIPLIHVITSKKCSYYNSDLYLSYHPHHLHKLKVPCQNPCYQRLCKMVCIRFKPPLNFPLNNISKHALTSSICSVTIRAQQQRHMVMLSRLDRKSQLDLGPECLFFAIILPSVEFESPDAPLHFSAQVIQDILEMSIVIFRGGAINVAAHGAPVGYSPIGVGRGRENGVACWCVKAAQGYYDACCRAAS